MLWSKTLIDADSQCPSKSFKLRSGLKGEAWHGFAVGSYVHAAIHHLGDPSAPAPDGSKLSVKEKVAATRLIENYSEMGFGDHIPEGAVFEESYASEIGKDGVPLCWNVAPSWAVRGPDWDPGSAEHTWYRVQPDVWFFNPENPKEIVIIDWKTTWGIPSNSTLESDSQAITYSAALAGCFPAVETVQFTWWNVRYKMGHTIVKSSKDWIDQAVPLWLACYQRDKDAGLEDMTRTGPHCGLCNFKKSCLSVEDADESMNDVDFYRHTERVKQLGRNLNSDLRERLKLRTGIVELPEGVSLGPKASSSYRWGKNKPAAIEQVFNSLTALGKNPFDYIDIKGSTSAWIDSLPEELQGIVLEHVSESQRVTFVTRKEEKE